MALSKQDKPALLLVDIQKGFDDIAYWGGQRNNPEAENNAAELLHLWRAKGLPVFHVQHCSTTPVSRLHPSHPGNALKDIVKPIGDEPVIQKKVNSAFIGTDLKERLDQANIKTLVIAGLTTDHCISTTTRMAGNFGYETFLVSDATATFNKKGVDGKNYSAELIHETALASLNDEFATVVTTEMVKQRV
jgi:nicotinamidase-related amidase